MNRSTSFRKGLAGLTAAIVLTPFALFAAGDSTLVDDLEGGKNENRLGQYWYYYDDSADKGTSKVTNATSVDADGKPVMAPTAGQGHSGTYAAEISWDMGDKQPIAKGKYPYSQMVGIGTMLCADGDEVDVSSATALKFWVKAKAAMKLYVEIASADVSESNEPFAYLCQTNIPVTTSWTQVKLNLADFAYPSWWADAPAEIMASYKRATKIQFKIDMTVDDEPNAGDKGTLYLDDIVLDGVYLPPFGVCGSCPGAAGQMAGISSKTVFSDFEAGTSQNKAKYYWYVFDDSKSRTGGDKSVFTAGTKPNEETAVDELVIAKDGTDGYDASKGLKVSYKLGDTYVDAKSTTIDPFCGVGSMFSNQDVYEKDNTVGLKATDGSGSQGIYFDYKTDQPIKFELYSQLDNVTLPEGAAFYTKLMPTGGEWKGATIKWTDLVLPGWKEVKDLGPISLNLKKLLKMQIQIQGPKGTTGTLQIDNIAFLGTAVYPSGVGVIHNVAQKAGSSISSVMTAKGLNVTLKSLPAGTHNGVVELVGTNGRVVAKQNVSVNGTSSLTLTTGKLSAGVYMLKVNTVYGNGKTYSNNSRVSILN